jgi:hypothetical protein
MLLFSGTFPRNCSIASNPPADAPIPTIGNKILSDSEGFSFKDIIGFMSFF